MDQYVILEFEHYDEAQTCLAAINTIAAAYWISVGYTVLEVNGTHQLIGKNAATGMDEPDSPHTITWDVIKTSPVGTYYITSLSTEPRFADGMEQLADFSYTEKTFPENWVVGE